VAVELCSDGLKGAAASLDRPQHWFNVSAAGGWLGYVLWRWIRSREAARAWGFRIDGFARSLVEATLFAVPAVVLVLAFGHRQGRLPLPPSFWLVACLYPVWGLAQQFALQALLTRNLRRVVPRRGFRAVAAATLFSAAHFPNTILMALNLVAGVALAWIYERHRNLWSLGIIHGFLGALAYYLVLGQDPGASLIGGAMGCGCLGP